MSVARLRHHNVVAAFASLEQADEALSALRREGFAAGELSVSGRSLDQAVAVRDQLELAEAPAAGEVTRGMILGGVAGTLVGGVAVAAATAGLVVLLDLALGLGGGILAGLAAGAGAGATVGVILGGQDGMNARAGWRQAWEGLELDGPAVVLGVHSGDSERVGQARGVLEDHDPAGLHRVNEQGEAVDTADPVDPADTADAVTAEG